MIYLLCVVLFLVAALPVALQQGRIPIKNARLRPIYVSSPCVLPRNGRDYAPR